MTKKEFLNNLELELRGLPSEVIKDILSDYEEHFEIGISKGKSEEEISKELGEPMEIARGYLTNYNSIDYDSNRSANNYTSKILLAILLIFANIVVLLGPFLGVVGILIGFYIIGIGFVFGGIALIFRLPMSIVFYNTVPSFLTTFSFGIGLGALGALVIILALFLSKFLYKLLVKYINWNGELINKRGVYNEC